MSLFKRSRVLGVLGVSLLWVVMQASAVLALADTDGDFVDDAVDNCPSVFNFFQQDSDEDGVGDLCDPDAIDAGTPEDDVIIDDEIGLDLEGGFGDDALYGSEGDDELDGGPGNDFLFGGQGEDELTGGSGCDRFGIDPNSPWPLVITDFELDVDRFAFPFFDETVEQPVVSFGGDQNLVATFTLDGEVLAVVEFEGIDPDFAAEFGFDFQFDTSPCVEVLGPDIPFSSFSSNGGGPTPEPEFSCEDLDELLAPGGFFVGSPLGDRIEGTDGWDFVLGDAFGPVAAGADDCINGYEGDDWLTGENKLHPVTLGGNDVIDGGPGRDKLYGESILGNVEEGGDDILIGGDCPEEEPNGVERSFFFGGHQGCSDNDELFGETEGLRFLFWCIPGLGDVELGGDDMLFGGEGNDDLYGESKCGDVGTGGGDMLDGGNGNDELYGETKYGEVGSDTGGDDVLIGGKGNDDLYGETYSGYVGAGGDDDLFGNDGNDDLYGESRSGDVGTGGDDELFGGANRDDLFGETEYGDVAIGGDDDLNGGDGSDDLYGESRRGNVGIGGDDDLVGGDGYDDLFGDTDRGNVTTAGDDTLSGGSDDDDLYGDTKSGDVGTAGDDTLTGGLGDDELVGDSLSGIVTTPGNDTFVFDVTSDFGDDVIYDPGAGVTAVGGADTAEVVGTLDTGVDTLRFEGLAGGLGALELITSVVDDSTDVTITFSGSAAGATIELKGIGTATNTIVNMALIDAQQGLEVVVLP